MSNLNLICKCGFKFAGAGEFRNCQAFVTASGQSGVICPVCSRVYVNGIEIIKPEAVSPDLNSIKGKK